MDTLKAQLRAIVGPEHLLLDPGELGMYGSDNISFVPTRLPLMAVRPGTVEETREVLRVARLTKMPVTPFSSSSNGHGGSIPCTPGITLDLRRMNRVHAIDEACRNAVIEPGVSFAQLQDQAKAKGLRCLVPIDLPSDSSVISSYVDMAPLYAWPRYGTESVLTMEVLLPNGEFLKTGIAAIPVVEKPYFPIGNVPPFLNRVWFGSQGTLGVVTKAIIKLKTDHQNTEVLFAPLQSLPSAFPLIREIKRLDSPVELFVADPTYLGGLLAENPNQLGPCTRQLAPHTAVIVLRGEEGEVAYQKADLLDLGAKMGVDVSTNLPGNDDAAELILAELDRPRGYHRFEELCGGYSTIPFICTATQVPMIQHVVGQIAGGFGFDQKRIGHLLLPVEAARFHAQYSFYFDKKDPKEAGSVRALFGVLSSTLIKIGAFFSRPYGDWGEQVYAKAGGYKTMLRQIKTTVDPDEIMNPGKLNF